MAPVLASIISTSSPLFVPTAAAVLVIAILLGMRAKAHLAHARADPNRSISDATRERDKNRVYKSARELAEEVRGPLRLYGIRGKDVEVLKVPEAYYDALCKGIQTAQRRIVIAVLDIASGEKENHLIDLLESACKRNRYLRATVLLDHCRMKGPGGFAGARQRLKDMAKAYPMQMQVFFYEHPETKRWFMKLFPDGARQVVGVSHMKALIFDEELIITGANLRGEYFDVRQDRYLRIQSRELSDVYTGVVEALGTRSKQPKMKWWHFRLTSWTLGKEDSQLRDRLLTILRHGPQHLKGTVDTSGNSQAAGGNDVNGSSNGSGRSEQSQEVDTWVAVDLQLASLGIREDEALSRRLFNALPDGAYVRMSTGYCNPSDHMLDGLRSQAKSGQVEMVVPCVWSSSVSLAGGDGDKWYEKLVANVYEGIESLVKERTGGGDNVRIYEYNREGFSYHAKGLWISCRGDRETVDVAMAGSSNFDRRGYERDLESEILLFTDDKDLSRRLRVEYEELQSRATLVKEHEWEERKQKLKGTVQGYAVLGVLGLTGSYL